MAMNTVIHGDCLDAMRGMGADTIDTIITDPPYGLSFMGSRWDHDVPGPDYWREALRVAKPGATLLAFGGTRTHHWLAVAIEEAGWKIRDCIMWLYGQGFPKSHNFGRDLNGWSGYGTALKPAWEPIIVAMKPKDGSFANNALTHGVAGLNIDRARIDFQNDDDEASARPQGRATPKISASIGAEPDAGRNLARKDFTPERTNGRWPANVILDPEAGAMLDEQTGTPTSGKEPEGGPKRGSDKFRNTYGAFKGEQVEQGVTYGDSGGASRFFYCAKASRSEREAGLEALAEKTFSQSNGAQAAAKRGEEHQGADASTGLNRVKKRRNPHPTVKPLDLMRYLCRLTKTPTGGVVLDPFAGSGSTLIAAALEGRDFIGIEKEAEYVEIARARIAHHADLEATA